MYMLWLLQPYLTRACTVLAHKVGEDARTAMGWVEKVIAKATHTTAEYSLIARVS